LRHIAHAHAHAQRNFTLLLKTNRLTRGASRAVLQPQSCKPHCAPALLPGGPVRPITTADRARLAAAGLLGRVGLEPWARAVGRPGGVRAAVDAALGAVGLRGRPG
jgi:hypothetical protein